MHRKPSFTVGLLHHNAFALATSRLLKNSDYSRLEAGVVFRTLLGTHSSLFTLSLFIHYFLLRINLMIVMLVPTTAITMIA